MSKKILITGSSGKIGQALHNGLANYFDIIPFDLPEHNATDYKQLQSQLMGCFAIIHLAFDYGTENSRTGKSGNPENLLMGQTVLAAAAKVGVEKCIMASSVNAVRTQSDSNWSYRNTKLSLERLTTEHAERYPDIDFTSIRFGRVTPADTPPELPLRDDQTWISKRDAASLVLASLQAEPTPEHVIVFGVSDRPNPPYDLANPWGWQPQDSFGFPATSL